MKLFLFDVDGTLIHSGGAGRKAIERTFHTLFKQSRVIDSIDFSGMTDKLIFNEALAALNISYSQNAKLADEIAATYLKFLEEEVSIATDRRICPGIRELLNFLTMNENCRLALLTGNFEKGARIKLAPFGLNHYFPVGGFSDDHMDRSIIARCAVNKAEKYFNINFELDEIFVIGDTEKDIQCGKANNFKTIAVATGNRSFDYLQSFKPDYVVESFATNKHFFEFL